MAGGPLKSGAVPSGHVDLFAPIAEPHVRRNLDSTVTVCRDFLRGGCSREQCRYFHPSSNLLASLESNAMMQPVCAVCVGGCRCVCVLVVITEGVGQ